MTNKLKSNIKFKQLIEDVRPDTKSIELVAEYLDYSVGENPVTENSSWKILFTDKIEDYSKGVIAIKTVDDLNTDSSTPEIRRLYKELEELKEDFSLSFDVQIVAFMGNQRMVFFPYLNGNRDTRLDLNIDNSEVTLYNHSFNLLKNENISVEEDIFGFGDKKIVLNISEIFKQELSSHFRQTSNFYRKKLSELITGSALKRNLAPLLDKRAKKQLENNDLINLVQERSYRNALSIVVDTIILRQLMRRFLEGYYGSNSFELSGIALGIGDGTLDDAIQRTVNANIKNVEEKDVKKLNQKKKVIPHHENQTSIFDFMDDEEKEFTAEIQELSSEDKNTFYNLAEKAQKQFETVYEGDLFAGSVGNVTNIMENELTTHYPEFVAQMWIDTSSNKYSFRYEDLPPNSIEEHYENSMSQNIQINIEEGNPVVFYGSTESEQKTKGAYYTDDRFVQYMVKQTVEKEIDNRIESVKLAVKSREKEKLVNQIDKLLDFKVADLTCGGGSFLRGAFLLISNKHDTISSIDFSEDILKKYPMFEKSEKGENEWEVYVLNNMIYGVDFDYKAILISSLTLSLSSLEHRRDESELPSLIGKTLIHQNSLINAVPFYKRENIYKKYQDQIKELRALKIVNDPEYETLRDELQTEIRKNNYSNINDVAEFMHVEALEINLPEVFFDKEGKLKDDGGFDCIIGNPPWEIWKTSEDEFYSEYDEEYPRSAKKAVKTAHINQMKLTNPFLEDKWEQHVKEIKTGSSYFRNESNYRFQKWKINGRKTGGDINLYVISVERFNQLLKYNGYFSLLVPDNFATDAGTTGVRHLVFDNYRIVEFLSFENRKGIFPAVHRSYKFAVLTYKKEKDISNELFDAFFYKLDLENLNNTEQKINYPINLIKSSEEYTFIEVSNEEELKIILKSQENFESLGESNLFDIGRDFDRTNDSKKFLEFSENLIPLYEGKLMNQFVISNEVSEGVTVEEATKKLGENFREYRIAIRSIARSTDKRSLIATLLPKFSVATNSLQIQRNAKGMPLQEKFFYLGILNSYIMDFYLRKLISSNVNKRYLMQLPVPKFNEIEHTTEIVSIVKTLLMKNGELYQELEGIKHYSKHENLSFEDLVAELNALIFIDYGLSREEVILVMKDFESAKHKNDVIEEAQRIIDIFDKI